MWLGITGRNGSGKDTAAHMLSKHGFTPLSTSDLIREEVTRRGLPQSRQSIQSVIEDWRATYGADVLIQKCEEHHGTKENVVIFSLRHPDEITTLRKLHDFMLIVVTAHPQVRFLRNTQRNRENAPKTFEEFLAEEQYEAEKADKRFFDMVAVEQMADFTINNNDTPQYMEEQINKLLLTIRQTVK